MCAYYSPLFLLPPHDLIQLATYIRERNGADVFVVDAIADHLSEEGTLTQIHELKPDVLVSIVGVESFGEDIACLDALKAQFPNIIFFIFGYYPSVFPEEILRGTTMDYILRFEPEEPLASYLGLHDATEDNLCIPGLAGRGQDGTVFINEAQRIADLDALPFPDYTLVNQNHYEEAFLGGPCGAILSARGCPFACSYCTTTYGRTLKMKSPEIVVGEMKHLIASGIRFIRFLDDTFTSSSSRVIEICRMLLDENLHISWSCLSRVDTLDEEMLNWMARAGCKRVLVGIESYSQNVLDFFGKGLDAKNINKQLGAVRKAGIESIGFFIVGAPVETEEDFLITLKEALHAPLDFITVNPMTPYAGTPFFEQVKHNLEFSLLPHKWVYKDPQTAITIEKRKRKLYIRFYLRPTMLWRHFARVMKNPLLGLRILWLLIRN